MVAFLLPHLSQNWAWPNLRNSWPPWFSAVLAVVLGLLSIIACAAKKASGSISQSNRASQPGTDSTHRDSPNVSKKTTKPKAMEENKTRSELFTFDVKPASAESLPGTDLNSLEDEQNPLQDSKVRDKLLKAKNKGEQRPKGGEKMKRQSSTRKQQSNVTRKAKKDQVLPPSNPEVGSTQEGMQDSRPASDTQYSLATKTNVTRTEGTMMRDTSLTGTECPETTASVYKVPSSSRIAVKPEGKMGEPINTSQMRRPGFFGRLFARNTENKTTTVQVDKTTTVHSAENCNTEVVGKSMIQSTEPTAASTKTRKTIAMVPVDSKMC